MLFLACIALGTAPPVLAQESRLRDRDVTLEELLAFAELHAPLVRVSEQRRGYAGAARAGAGPLLRYNPTMELGLGPRFDGTSSSSGFDFYASLGQPVEIAGERGLRLDAASRLSEQLEAEAVATRWEVRREVVLAFRAAVVSREGVAIANRLAHFSGELLSIARRQLAAGDTTAIDVLVAESDAAQASQARLSREQELRSAQVRLCEVTGWPLETPPQVPAGLEAPRAIPTLASMMRIARDQHPDLRARRAATLEAHARLELADREAWPTPVFGAELAREGSANGAASYILLGTVGLPLPFWQLNQGERLRARVDEDVARVEEAATTHALHSRIARAHSELTSAAERLALFTSSVSPSLVDSLDLLARGLAAGEIPLLSVVVARERLFQSQRDALSAYADYYRALAEIESAMGAELPDANAARATGGAP